jgi:hypothetical protein
MGAPCDRDKLSAKLIELLGDIDFGRSYFEYYRTLQERAAKADYAVGRKELEAILANIDLDFTYCSKENFFQHVERNPRCEIFLNVSFQHSQAEFILYVRTDCGVIGGPYPRLARQVVQASDPNFTPSPPSPKLPFSNEAELREVVQFGLTFFKKARNAILSFDGWRP